MHTGRPLTLFLLMLAVIAAAGCGRRPTNVAQGNREQILHVGNFVEPADLDPQVVSSHQETQILLTLFEGLAQYDPRTSEPRPGVAARWETSADGLTWTFHLRPDARWSNGDAVTAGDFVFAWRRLLTPSLGAEYASLLHALRHARALHEGKSADFAALGARADGDHTLVLHLEHPVPHLATMVCHPAWSPLHRTTLARHDGLTRRGTAWTRPGNLVGNGPFVLAEWRPQQFVRVAKNPHYWDRSRVRLNGAVFHAIDSEDAEERAYRTGQLHVTSTVPISKLPAYRASQPAEIESQVFLATFLLRFNTAKPPLDDTRVRRALSLAVDRERLVRDVLKGGQVPAGHLTPPGTAGFTSRSRVGFDAPAARALLAEAGYGPGRALPPIEYLFNSSEANRLVAEALQQMWKQHLGIDVSLRNQESRAHLAAMRTGDYQIARFAWSGDYLDPSTFLELLTGGSGNNQTNWRNAGYDQAFAEAARTGDQAHRYELFQRCEEILARESPVLPIYYYVRHNLRRPEVKGWHGNLLDLHPLNHISLEPPR